MKKNWEVHPRNIGFDTIMELMEFMGFIEFIEFLEVMDGIP